jgi:Pyruvate/2-oxoacid:ferredoxin oxidoreductase delta subunit
MTDDIIDELREVCSRHSISEMASCSIRSLKHEETVSRLRDILPDVQTILLLLKRIPDGMIECAHDLLYQKAALQTFDDLSAASEEMVSCLRRHGVTALWPGRQKTPHQKHIAVRAGVGSIGDCRLLISSRHGIDVHLESVIVAEEIRIPSMDRIQFKCDACGLCFAACPVRAIEPGKIDRDRCVEYRRTKVVPYRERKYCGLCMKACPQREHPTTDGTVRR